MKKSVCYVDDDESEIKRFRDNLGSRYIIGAGTTLADALKELNEKHISKPDIFLLDLYFGPSPDEKKRRAMLQADAELVKMERKVRELLVSSGQSHKEGFSLAEEASATYPRVPRVFFSRRAFLEDVMEAEEKGLKLLEKPDPEDGEDYDVAFKRNANLIGGKIDRIIELNGFWARYRERIEGFLVGLLLFAVKISWETLTG
jgi:hypothetical protein